LSKLFTLSEAQRLIPEIGRILRVCLGAKHAYDEAEKGFKAFNQRIALSGGMLVSHQDIGRLYLRKQEAKALLKATLEELQQTGVHLKDLETGLIDFPTLYRDREVYLCWKFGELSIAFWHAVEDGFPGRKPIDPEFVRNHRGSR
jgi:hypothetical protein